MASKQSMNTNGYWIAWQALGANGPGRWSNDHYTRDGARTLCGHLLPRPTRCFRLETATGVDQCVRCRRSLDKENTRAE